MNQFTKERIQALLAVLACVFCVWALQGRETLGYSQRAIESAGTHQLSGATPSASPTPSTEEKRPHVLRRFFGWTIEQVKRPFRKEPRIICSLPPFVDISASKTSITFCPSSEGSTTAGYCSPDRKVELVVRSMDPYQDNQFRFAWAVTGGTIKGEGRRVSWDLNGVPEGTYTATVEMRDEDQHAASASTTVTISLCWGCEKPRIR